MPDLRRLVKFEWDKGNLDKSYEKHGITVKEAEELFLDKDVVFVEDIKHSQKEARLIAIGKTFAGKILFAVFTIRKDKVRIISVRRVNKKERRQYEETI